MNALRSFVSVSLAVAAGCAISLAALAQTTLKVAEGSRSFTAMPVYIAIDAGYFAEKGIKVELVTMKGGPAAANALMSGDVDVAVSLAETPIKMKGQGKDLRVLTLVQDRNPCVLVVPAASKATKLADLKGKKIGVTATGSLSDLVARAYIRAKGMQERDFELIGLGSGATVAAAFERGQIDAAMTFTPFLTKLLTEKTGRIVYDFRKEVYPGQSTLIRGSDVGGPKDASLKNFAAAMMKAQKTLHDDKALTSKIAKSYFPDMNPQLLEAMVVNETSEIPVFSKDGKFTRSDFDALTDFLVKNKLSPKAEKYEEIVAAQYWQ
jgi:NitT/TauT family transport system substrate-binding protein